MSCHGQFRRSVWLACTLVASVSFAAACIDSPALPAAAIVDSGAQSGVPDSAERPVPDSGAQSVASDGAADSGDAADLYSTVYAGSLRSVDVPLCTEGYGHPNICCLGMPGEPTSCVEYASTPFRICDSRWLTFPDARTCCSLSDHSHCIPSPTTPPGRDGAVLETCHSLCGPGGYPPVVAQEAGLAPLPDVVCCTGSGMQMACVLPFCNAPVNTCDADSKGACTGPGQAQPCGPQCGDCPSGWHRPVDGQLDLCCRAEELGGESCFSQADVIN
jgi:hypothetical protein